MIKQEMIEWINSADYSQLLRHWRFAKAGDPFFVSDIGDYYVKKMDEERNKISDAEAIGVSKEIGWKNE